MREHEEFPTETEPAGSQAPIVIVQQSGRGWSSILVPPALILMAAVAILSYQIRPMTPPELIFPGKEDPPAPVAAANPAEALDLGPLVVRSKGDRPDSAPEPEPEPEPEPIPEPVPEPKPEPAKDDRNPFDLPDLAPQRQEEPAPRAEIVAVEPEADADAGRVDQRPGAEAIWGNIEQEAQQVRARREQVNRLRDEQFDREQRQTLEKIQQAHQDAAASRRQYLAELSLIVRHHGLQAAPHIAELTSRYGRNAPSEVHEVVNRARADLDASRASPEERIALLRHLGCPEPLVLDDVARQMEKAIGSRRGPTNRNQAIVHAARKLLGTPLDQAPTFPAAARARNLGQ